VFPWKTCLSTPSKKTLPPPQRPRTSRALGRTSTEGYATSAAGRFPLLTDVQAYPAPPYPPVPHNYCESGTPLPIASVPVVGLPLANSMPPKSTVPLPASGISPNNTHLFTRVDATSNFPVALIPLGTSHIPPAPPVESREKRGPQSPPHQRQKSRKKGELGSLHWSRPPADSDLHEARIPRFFCDDCDAKYVQLQGLNRHRQEKHERDEHSLCICCDAKCGRPYEYRAHIEKHHPEVDPNIILGKAAGSRRRTAYLARPRSQQVLLPTIEQGRRNDFGIRPYPPPAVKPSTATLPPPDMTYVPELESTQTTMMGNSIPEGTVDCIMLSYLFSQPLSIHVELAQTAWIALFGALQEENTEYRSEPPIQPRNGTYRRPGPYTNYLAARTCVLAPGADPGPRIVTGQVQSKM
jgi:hypothetical protein